MNESKIKVPNTIVIHPDFANIKTLRKKLIPEGSELRLSKVTYTGEIVTKLVHKAPIHIVEGAYYMEFTEQSRAVLRCPVLNLNRPEINNSFDEIMDKLCGLRKQLFPKLERNIAYKIKNIELSHTKTGDIFRFKTFQMKSDLNNISKRERVMMLSKINQVSIEKMPPEKWLDRAMHALQDVFYVTCTHNTSEYTRGDSCMSLAMYREFQKAATAKANKEK